MLNAIVFFGGKSAEHDISIITGLQVLENIDSSLYNIVPIYITRDGTMLYGKNLDKLETFKNFDEKKYKKVVFLSNDYNMYIKSTFGLKKIFDVDVAIICCHGLNGEDGTLQGMLELSNIPYTSSGVLASSTSMDKIVMKRMFEALCLPVVKWQELNVFEIEFNKLSLKSEIEDRVGKLNFPIIVKPANLGSSIGINVCNNLKEVINAVNVAKEYDNKILIEEAVKPLKEINCSCFGDETSVMASVLEEPVSYKEFLTFDEKYMKQSKIENKPNIIDDKKQKQLKRKIPSSLNQEDTLKIQEFSKKIFKSFCCKGVVRIDYLVNEKTNEIFVNEINSIPGSMAYYLWEDKYTFSELIDKMVFVALKEFKEKNRKKYCFNSEVLEKFNNSSVKIGK